MFDKLLYRKRREQGLRGQGDKPAQVFKEVQPRNRPKRVSKKARKVTTG